MENQKPGFWDLFLGRLIGSCVVGCWILGAILLIIGFVLIFIASSNPEFLRNLQ
jgi:hypothetical protein